MGVGWFLLVDDGGSGLNESVERTCTSGCCSECAALIIRVWGLLLFFLSAPVEMGSRFYRAS